MKKFLMIAAACCGTHAVAEVSAAPDDAFPQQCRATRTELESINGKYQTLFAQLEDEGDDIKGDSKSCDAWAEFDCDWKRQDLIFDTPSVKMKTQEWKFDILQTKLTDKEIKFDTLKTYSEVQKIGQYPEFRCHGLKCKVTWTDIKTTVPVFKWETTRIVMGVPEFWWDTTSMKLDVPEFFMERQHWKMDLPSCKLVGAGISDCEDHLKERSKALEDRSKQLNAQQRMDAARTSSDLFGCLADDLTTKRKTVETMFNASLGSLDAAMASIAANGADTSKVTVDGSSTSLQGQRAELVARREQTLKTYDERIADLQARQQSTVALIMGKENVETTAALR